MAQRASRQRAKLVPVDQKKYLRGNSIQGEYHELCWD